MITVSFDGHCCHCDNALSATENDLSHPIRTHPRETMSLRAYLVRCALCNHVSTVPTRSLLPYLAQLPSVDTLVAVSPVGDMPVKVIMGRLVHVTSSRKLVGIQGIGPFAELHFWFAVATHNISAIPETFLHDL